MLSPGFRSRDMLPREAAMLITLAGASLLRGRAVLCERELNGKELRMFDIFPWAVMRDQLQDPGHRTSGGQILI